MPVLYRLTYSQINVPGEIIEQINSLPIKGKPYAAFDLDNTLLIGDIGEAVFALLVKKGLIKNFGWKNYLQMIEIDKVKAYKHIIDLMAGMNLSLLKEITEEAISGNSPISLEGFSIPIPKPNKQMKLILEMLTKRGIPVYVVTASNEVSARIICKKHFDIPPSNIIGAEVAYDKQGIIIAGSKEFPYGKGKVNILKKRFKHRPIVTGGDSPGDKYLLDYTTKVGICFWLGK